MKKAIVTILFVSLLLHVSAQFSQPELPKQFRKFGVYNELKLTEVFLLDSMYRYVWDIGNSEWVMNFNMHFTYDPNGNLTDEFFEYWDNLLHQWNNSYKSKSLISYYNLCLQKTSWGWDEILVDWEPQEKYIYEYSTENIMKREIHQTWDLPNNEWDNISAYDYFYATEGSLNTINYLAWDNGTFSWDTTGKQTFFRLPDGSKEFTYIWDFHDATQTYTLVYLIESWMHQPEKQDSIILNVWDESIFEWVPLFFYSYSYNTLNLKTEELYLTWETASQSWIPQGRRTYEYNSDNQLVVETEYSNNGIDWDEVLKYEYFYTDVTSIAEPNSAKLVPYPVPVQDIVTINLPSLSDQGSMNVYDITGQCVLTLEIRSNPISIDVKNLPSGIYYLTTTSGFSGKMLKE